VSPIGFAGRGFINPSSHLDSDRPSFEAVEEGPEVAMKQANEGGSNGAFRWWRYTKNRAFWYVSSSESADTCFGVGIMLLCGRAVVDDFGSLVVVQR
jgi:hypothetical protein